MPRLHSLGVGVVFLVKATGKYTQLPVLEPLHVKNDLSSKLEMNCCY